MDKDIKKQFSSIDLKFSLLDSKFDVFNSRFDKLKVFLIENFLTKQEFYQVIDQRLADLPTKQDFQNLISTVDGYAKQVKDTNQEIVMLGQKAYRLESWAKVAGNELGVEYNP